MSTYISPGLKKTRILGGRKKGSANVRREETVRGKSKIVLYEKLQAKQEEQGYSICLRSGNLNDSGTTFIRCENNRGSKDNKVCNYTAAIKADSDEYVLLESSHSVACKRLKYDASTGKGLWDQIKSTHDLFPQRDPEDELARKRRELMLLNYAEESTPPTTLSLRRIIKKEQLEDDLSVNDDDLLSLVGTTSIGGSQNIVIAKEPVKPPSSITVWDDKTKLKVKETWTTYVRSCKRNAQPSGEIIDIMDQKLLYKLAEFRFDGDIERITSEVIHEDIALAVADIQSKNKTDIMTFAAFNFVIVVLHFSLRRQCSGGIEVCSQQQSLYSGYFLNTIFPQLFRANQLW
eukprot:CAMPEP_0204862368 /NCGR_PEP_ID=MMETSP1348-20121228/2433_1 /ASSEMBLY_ACC=CAM_ASM_000700 /TAXON_ID=215587 /ORGANISM="Aplanochytrium stocchinoi, Strain GSBS06" /LENGTH=346 /DNA_ID=CAMNT_0052012243 /DNA_START=16 /DNA_END=1054 /DNA_ORIENTATION=-